MRHFFEQRVGHSTHETKLSPNKVQLAMKIIFDSNFRIEIKSLKFIRTSNEWIWSGNTCLSPCTRFCIEIPSIFSVNWTIVGENSVFIWGCQLHYQSLFLQLTTIPAAIRT